MAADAVVRRKRRQAYGFRSRATFIGVAGHALGIEVCGSLRFSGLDVRVVAGGASHLLCLRLIDTCPVALTHDHGVVVLGVIWARRVLWCWGDHQDGHDAVERLAGTEILVGLAGLEDACIASMMAGHANVIGQG